MSPPDSAKPNKDQAVALALELRGRARLTAAPAVDTLSLASADMLEQQAAQLAILEQEGPQVVRGTSAAGLPKMGSMRVALKDAWQAAQAEAREADRLRVELARTRQMLSSLQWSKLHPDHGNTNPLQCPVCLADQLTGHKPDCALNQALGLQAGNY